MQTALHPFEPPSFASAGLARAQRQFHACAPAERRLRQALARQYDCHAPDILTARRSTEDAGYVTRKSFALDGFGYFQAPASAEAYLLAVDLGKGSRQVVTGGPGRGEQVFGAWTVGLRRLDEDHAAHLHTAFDFAYVYITKATLETQALELGQRFASLSPAAGVDDPVLVAMTQALLPSLQRPAQACRLFVDHMMYALSLHLAQRYGDLRESPPWRGGLARWQRRRAEEILGQTEGGEAGLDYLASECGLSRGYFVKAFKATYGTTPHKWLSRARIDRAKRLLLESDLPVAEIALRCGFVDQSHLTRVFSQFVGAPPARWRRHLGA